MAVGLYMDVHVPQAITDQLRRRGVDVMTVIEDDRSTLDDSDLLKRALEVRRLIFTQDIRFKSRAEDWQRQGLQFSGLVFGHQLGGTIGQYVQDLELIAKASEIVEWANVVQYLPFPRKA